jgi:hypothetical protein
LAFKRSQPSLRFALSEQGISADEMDVMQQYVIVNPTTSATWVGTFPVAGTAATGTLVFVNAIMDYPRNAEVAIAGSATGMAGTATLYGRDQFGNKISEVFGFGSTDNGGTVVGTKIFSQFSAGTLLFGTAVGNGTARVGVGTLGTTALFGLPNKLGGTTDVKAISWGTNHVAVSVNGGTIAGLVNVPMSAIAAAKGLGGTATTVSVLYKPSYITEAQLINVPQRT